MFKLYEVDPEADTLLIISQPTRPFAPWQQDDENEAATLSPYAGLLPGLPRPPNPYARITAQPEYRLKVSSKHLALASKPLRNRLRHAKPNADDGRIHLTLPSQQDPAAVIIVMDAIHGRSRKVPRSLDSIEALAKVAAVVDALRCGEAVEIYAERWFAALLDETQEGGLPDSYGRELMLWIYAAYVFRQTEVFRQATRIAVVQSQGPVRNLGLAIRDGLIREIDARRQQAVRQALDIIHAHVAALQNATIPSCAHGCETFLLGALVRALQPRALLWPAPAKPFVGTSFVGLAESVRDAKLQVTRLTASLGQQQQQQQLWGGGGRKRKTPNAAPLTPEMSPESSVRAFFEEGDGQETGHMCEALVGLVERLEGVEKGVEGLELESRNGFYLY